MDNELYHLEMGASTGGNEKLVKKVDTYTIVGLLVVIAVTVVIRAPSLSSHMWNVDEGIQAAIANIVLHGGVPYKDGVCQRGPVTFYLFAIVFHFFGKNNVIAIHCALLLLTIFTSIMVYLIARYASGKSIIATLSALIYVLISSLGWGFDDTYAFHTEFCVAFFTSLAMLFFLWGLSSRRRLLLHFLSGVSYGFGFFSKQPALFDFLAPLLTLGYLALATERPESTRNLTVRTVILCSVALLSGFVAVAVGWSCFFYARGAWTDFVFYFFTYNLEYYIPAIPLSHRLLLIPASFGQTCCSGLGVGMTAFIGFLFIIFGLSSNRSVPQIQSTQIAVCIWAVMSFLGSAMTGRLYGHYMIQAIPSWSILSGIGLGTMLHTVFKLRDGPADEKSESLRWMIGITAASFLVGILAAGYFRVVPSTLAHIRKVGRAGSTIAPRDVLLFSRFEPTDMVSYIRQNTPADSRIFIWGFKPYLYGQTDRRPASRYVYCAQVAGFIPWEDEYKKPVPGAIDILVSELRGTMPELIIDTSVNKAQGEFFGKFPMDSFESLWDFVQSTYRLEKSFPEADIYRLRR